mmetsp:Transcript_45988/g.144075  ORF Transcript_45988/g.144075 Transcript_45988/m.144075 type:complete len:97 (+) Transcript_45988:127-417(+)
MRRSIGLRGCARARQRARVCECMPARRRAGIRRIFSDASGPQAAQPRNSLRTGASKPCANSQPTTREQKKRMGAVHAGGGARQATLAAWRTRMCTM